MSRVVLSILGLVVVAMPELSWAQGVRESTSVHRRNDCRLAVQILTAGRPHPHYEWALDAIASCDESGGAALAAVWNTPPSDEEQMNILVYRSESLRDRAVLDAVMFVAGDAGGRVVVRLSALRVLGSYFSPRVHFTLENASAPRGRA